MQRPCGKPVEIAPSDKRLLAAVGHPDLRWGQFRDRTGQLIPIAVIGQDDRQFHALLARALADTHPARGKARNGIGKAPGPAVLKGGRRADNDTAGKILRRTCFQRRRGQGAKIDALRLVIVAEFCQGTMDVDRSVIAGIAQHADDPLRLAQCIGADEMRAFRKLFDGFYQLGDFVPGIGMPEHRQGEGRLGYEHVAGNGFKPDAGGIRRPLVVTRTDDAHAILLDGNLC